MKNLGVVGNFLMGLVVVASIFSNGANLNSTKFWMLLLLGLGYNILAHKSKFGSTLSSWSAGHGLIFLIYLFNVICTTLEHSVALSIAIGVYHMFLIKEPSSLNIYGFIIGLLVYLYEAYQIFNEPEKTFVTILKLAACAFLIAYYFNHIFGSDHSDSHTHKKSDDEDLA